VYLVGVDAQSLAVAPSVDYAAVLDRFQAQRINKVRIWLDAWFAGTRVLRPWAYDAKTERFDLDAWNDAYWRRLRAFVAAAQARDIIVEVSIFQSYANDASPDGWWRNPSWRQAWNKDFNSNHAFSTNRAGHFFPNFYTLTNPERSASAKTLFEYQQALVDKVIATLAPFHNVYYEIDNEFSDDRPKQDDVYPWQQYWARYVRQRSEKLVSVHAGSDLAGGGVQYYWDQPYVDVLDFHFYDQNPDHISALLHSAQGKGKILQCNESYGWFAGSRVDMRQLDGATREAWAWFVSGGYYAIYGGHHIEYAGWEVMARRLKVLHDLASQGRWWRMSPVDPTSVENDTLAFQGPTRHWQILADPGAQYVIYYWDDGDKPTRVSAEVRLAPGSYRYRWYDPTDGAPLATGTVGSVGGRTVIPAPPSIWNPAVGVLLFIQREQPAKD
jgi:hypothetical protein